MAKACGSVIQGRDRETEEQRRPLEAREEKDLNMSARKYFPFHTEGLDSYLQNGRRITKLSLW